MIDLLTIEVIENDRGGHDDLLLAIPELLGSKTFDTYYFCLAIEPKATTDDIRNAVAQLLQFWLDKIEEMKNEEIVYLPIDFSDQYTGCLKVLKKATQLILNYGFSRREGWAVNPLNPNNFYKEINDFQSETEKQLAVDKANFIFYLDKQIQKLKK